MYDFFTGTFRSLNMICFFGMTVYTITLENLTFPRMLYVGSSRATYSKEDVLEKNG